MKGLVRINCLIVVPVIYLLAQQTSTIKAQPKQTGGLKVRSEMLVSTDWLAKHINDRDVFVIHVAADRKHYDDGHLPGARFLSSKEMLLTIRTTHKPTTDLGFLLHKQPDRAHRSPGRRFQGRFRAGSTTPSAVDTIRKSCTSTSGSSDSARALSAASRERAV
jgi:Hen1-like subunit of RNA repair complex